MAQATQIRQAIHSLAYHRNMDLASLRGMTERQLLQLLRDIKT